MTTVMGGPFMGPPWMSLLTVLLANDFITNWMRTRRLIVSCGFRSYCGLVYSTKHQNEHSYKVYDQFGTLIHEKTSSANNSNGPESTYGIQLCDAPNLIMEKKKDILFIQIQPRQF